MKKRRLMAICLVMMLLVSGALAGCSKKPEVEEEPAEEVEQQEEVKKGNPDELFSQYWENGDPVDPKPGNEYNFDVVGYLKACGCEDVEITTEGTVNSQVSVVFYENGWRCEVCLNGNINSNSIAYGDGSVKDCTGSKYFIAPRYPSATIKVGSNGESVGYAIVKSLPFIVKTLRLHEYNQDGPKNPDEFRTESSFAQKMDSDVITVKLQP